MHSGPRLLVLKAVLACCATLSVASAAHSQDFYLNTASARSNALGGTSVASSSDALDGLAANPAGLSYLRGRNLNLDVDAIFARGSFSNSVNSNSPMRTGAGVIPYGAFGMPIDHSRFSVAVGVMPDLLSVSDWRYEDAPGVAGASYGIQEQKAAIVAIRSAAGVSFAFSKKFSVGATIGLQRQPVAGAVHFPKPTAGSRFKNAAGPAHQRGGVEHQRRIFCQTIGAMGTGRGVEITYGD